jgi:hypothetical protein
MIDVQSAGGRNTLVAVSGEHADLQLLGIAPRYYSYYSMHRRQADYFPFTWQPNLAKDADDAYQVRAPMTPWGRRRLHATAFKRELRRLDFRLELDPGPSQIQSARQPGVASGISTGVFSLKLANPLPFDITDCRLDIGVTADVNGLMDVYHTRHLPDLAAGGNHQETFQADFQTRHDDRYFWSWPPRPVSPRISRLGAASAWIIGSVKNSPILSFDEQRSDFVQQEEYHFFVQEILPEDMPNGLVASAPISPAR